MTSRPLDVPARVSLVRPWLMAGVTGVLLVAMLAYAAIAIRRALPGAVQPDAVSRRTLTLEPGQAVWQSIYLPACTPEQIVLELTQPVDAPGSLGVAWFTLEDPSRWPAAPIDDRAVLLEPGDTRVVMSVPHAARGRLAGLRVTADRVTVGLPVARDNPVPTGYVSKRPGYLSTEDLVFAAAYRDQAWQAAAACIVRAQPAAWQQPMLLAGALVAVCVAGAWLASTPGRRQPRRWHI